MSPIDPSLRIRSARLAVADLQRSADFYERVLGLPLIERDDRRVLLGTDPADPSLELSALAAPSPVPRGSTGLFHIAWLHPSRAALAQTVRRVAATRWPFQGASDHGVSEALYLSDPDGLGIEIYSDRPRELWQRPGNGHGVVMVTEPLDVEDLLGTWPDEPEAAMTPGTGIGHVHLKVADVARAAEFYEGLGFEPQALLPAAAFVSAGGYHHHLGMNSWQSAGGAVAPPSAPGLRGIEFALSGGPALEQLGARAGTALSGGGGSLETVDPDGNELRFTALGGLAQAA